MIPLPHELLEELRRGNVLFFCGMDLSSGANRPTAAGLARELAERAGVGKGGQLSLPEAAEAYELALGRNGLVRFLLDRLQADAAVVTGPPAAVQLVASLPVHHFVTTAWDNLLERALPGSPDVVVDDEDVPYVDPRNALLIKLRGTLSRKSSLVLTPDDMDDLFVRRPEVVNLLRGLLATKTVVFLGFDLDSADFKQLYQATARHLGQHLRRGYAVQLVAGAMVERYWSRKNVTVIRAEPMAFLQALLGEAGKREAPQGGTGASAAVQSGLQPDL